MILITSGVHKCERATQKSAGYDLRAVGEYNLLPGQVRIVSTDIRLSLPDDVMGLVCSRSGLSSRGIVVNNAPGIIDADYTDEVKVILLNQTDDVYQVKDGDKVAQLVFTKWMDAGDVVTIHREGGLGSTDK
jgi:dUTP pyrophosphatase